MKEILIFLGITIVMITVAMIVFLVAREVWVSTHCTTVLGTQVCK